jgi:O-antigen/teichoic acid export membrane protein
MSAPGPAGARASGGLGLGPAGTTGLAAVLARWRTDDGLTRRASLNALASGLDYGARLVVGFVVNPLLVDGLGRYGYGSWQILGRLAGYASVATGRPTQALKWTIAASQASADVDAKRRHVGSALAAWLLFLPALAGAGALLTWLAPALLAAPPGLAGPVRFAAAVLALDLIVDSLVEIPRAVLRGENLGYKRMGLSSLLVALGGGLTALALALGGGLGGVAVAQVATTLGTGAVFLRVARTQVPWFGWLRPGLVEVRRFLGLSAWFLLWRALMQLMLASDVVLLGLLASVEAVATYTLTKYLPETLVSLVAIVVFGVTPGLGGVIGSGDLRRAARVRGEIMAATWLIATAVGGGALLWNASFVRLWVGREHDAGPLATALIVAMVFQFVLIRNDANIIDLTLDLRRKVLMGAASAAAALGAAGYLVAVRDAGVPGLCVGFIAGRAILSLAYPAIVGRALAVPLAGQLGAALRPAAVTVALFAVLWRAGVAVGVHSWLVLVPAVLATLAAVGLLALYAGLARPHREALWRRARRALGGGR